MAAIGIPAMAAPSQMVTSPSTVTPATAPGTSNCPWVNSHASIPSRVDQLLQHMTLDDEITMVHGTAAGAYTGLVAGNPALCIPELKLQDGPVGVRMNDTTQLPSGTDLAATFDPQVARSYGTVIGAEDRAKGVNVDLGPTINIVRDPRWGRSFESYSEDPYLTGQIASGDVEGIQSQGVMAQVKHWAVYNQETNRNTPQDNVEISDRAVHEIYAAAFGTVIDQAHPSSVMCSYSTVNGTYACENAYLDHILDDELGFTGFITSDWGGTHSTVASANAGMDMEMPGSTYFGSALEQAVLNGQVPRSRLDDMVRRILTQEFRFGLFEHKFPDTPDADVSTPAHVQTALQVAEDGAVLLKNTGGVLPLSAKDRSIAVIGDGAGPDTMSHGGGSATVAGTGTVTPLQGITARAQKDGATVTFAQGNIGDNGYPTVDTSYLTPPSGTGHGLEAQYYANATLSGSPVLTRTDPDVSFTWNGAPAPGVPAPGVPATNFSVRWTGTLTPPATGTYTFGLTSDDGSRLLIDGQQVIDNWRDQAPNTETAQVPLTAGHPVSIEVDYYQAAGGAMVNLGWVQPGSSPIQQAADLAAKSDVAIVYANKYESEGSDLADIDLSADQNALISAVAAANPHTVVVLNTGSAVTMPWLDQVAGVFEAWYPGQQSGNAIAALLYGDVNPSGKLPVTFPTSLAQVPAATPAQWPGVDGTVQYSEGLKVGYRWYDSENLTPLFPFGFGLSYTSFAFSHLAVSPIMLPGGKVHVSAVVTNTGSRSGAEVAQLYLTDPAAAGEPGRQLKGFVKVNLQPHESRAVTFTVTTQDASSWNTDAQAWALTTGEYTVQVGDSSRSLPLSGSFQVSRTAGPESTTVTAPPVLIPGSTATVTTTYTNGSTQAALDATTSLDLPAGWTATASTAASWASVPAGQQRQVTWAVSVPADAAGGSASLSATTRYTLATLPVQGNSAQTNPNPVTVQVAYPDLAAAFNTVGVTDDSDPGPGNFDGHGYSFSAQALAAVGITPGQPVGDTGFTWPDVAAGKPDVVTTAGQIIALGGSGSTLSFLGAANNGVASGPVSVTYTDGSTSTGTLTFADWWSNAAAPGTSLVATVHWNEPPDSPYPADHPVSLYSMSIPLDPGKQVAYVALPDNSRLHVFGLVVG